MTTALNARRRAHEPTTHLVDAGRRRLLVNQSDAQTHPNETEVARPLVSRDL